MDLRYAAARATLWLLTDLPAFVDASILHSHSRMPVRRLWLECVSSVVLHVSWCVSPARARKSLQSFGAGHASCWLTSSGNGSAGHCQGGTEAPCPMACTRVHVHDANTYDAIDELFAALPTRARCCRALSWSLSAA